MNLYDILKTALVRSFTDLINGAVGIIPGILILLVGWLIARLVKSLALRSLKAAKFDDLLSKIGLDKFLLKFNPDAKGSSFLASLIYALLLLAFVSSAAHAAGWTTVSLFITNFFNYLPTLLVAIAIFVIGLMVADVVKGAIITACESIGISGARGIGNLGYYVIAIFIGITAMNQAGIETTLITTNLTLVIGAILFAFSLSYGLASRWIATNLLSSYYSKGKFKPGQKIQVREIIGVIEQIDSISVTLASDGKKYVLPSKTLIEEPVIIVEDVID